MMPASRQSQGSGLQTEPARPDKSLGELVAEMTGEISALMRKEVELAKVEIKEEVGAAGKVGDKVSGAASTVSDAAGNAASTAGSAAGSAAGSLKEAPHTVKEVAARKTQGAPLVAGLVAFGAGALVASLVKGSETEARVAQTVLDNAQPLKEAATEAGQELVSSLKDQGQQAFQQVKETATQAGQEVKDQAQQATQETIDPSRDATQDLNTQ